ncbi:20096_t:CDS:1, partial [Funneliformis geosporum]
PALYWCLKTIEAGSQCDNCREIMKDVQTYKYYRNSMRIQSTYRIQLEGDDIHIEIGENTEKYTTCGNLSTDIITKLKDFLCRNINSFATTIQ